MTVAPPSIDTAGDAAQPQRPRSSAGARALRFLGWLLIAAGTVVLLYLVYSLLFTNLETEAAQGELLERWELEVEAPRGDAPATAGEAAADPEPVAPGSALAVLQFARPGAAEPPVRSEPLFVVSGVSVGDLTRGPGHYPDTALPGQPGNFAVAGHRTTYGAPFFHLDQLVAGDEVLVTDRQQRTWTYRVVEQRIVGPDAGEVLGPDPMGSGRPTLTLTTCHPRFSNRERMIVFAELVEDDAAEAGA